MERHGQVVEKEELIKQIWAGTIIEEGGLTRNISELRKALGESPDERRYIATIPGRGYRFVAQVRRVEQTDDERTLTAPTPTESPAASLIEETSNASRSGSLEVPSPAARSLSDLSLGTPKKRSGRGMTVGLLGLLLAGATIPAFTALRHWPFSGDERSEAGTLRPATTYQGKESDPSFSPDGSQIAFIWSGENQDNDDLYIKLIDTGAPLRLTTNPLRETSPSWSPDGRYIAFLREETTGGRDLYLISALGGEERKLVWLPDNHQVFDAPDLSWSADGKHLAVNFIPSPGKPAEIYLIDTKTAEKTQLTTPPMGYTGDDTATFSPDGKSIAFVRWSTSGAGDLFVMPESGGAPRQLTFDKMSIRGLSWTSDAKEIIYASERRGLSSLWRIRATGGDPVTVERAGANAYYPAIASRGRRLAYTQSTTDTNIWRIDLKQASQQRRPTQLIASTFDDHSPQYSPDGSKIAFISTRSGSYEIWICERDGQRPVQLTSIGGPLTGSPRWSPDGRSIAFDSRPQGNADLYIVDLAGGPARRLTSEASEEVLPFWSRDGRWIYFNSNRTGTRQIWKMPREGGPATQLTQKNGFEGFESHDGASLYFTTRSWQSGIWRMPSDGGEPALILDPTQGLYRRNWVLAGDGVYFACEMTRGRHTIEFLNFAAAKRTLMFTAEKPLLKGSPGFAISPDGRWLLFTQFDQQGSDLMFIDDFR